MPATANEKQVASSADHILTAAQQTRKEIEYSLRDLTRLEQRYALGKKMEDWAPKRLAELAEARASAVRMYTSYHQLVRAGNEQLTLQREGVTIRQATGQPMRWLRRASSRSVLSPGPRCCGNLRR